MLAEGEMSLLSSWLLQKFLNCSFLDYLTEVYHRMGFDFLPGESGRLARPVVPQQLRWCWLCDTHAISSIASVTARNVHTFIGSTSTSTC